MNKKAQHLMELSVLLVVVMASILVMGPYVIRSVNAQFKGWDDSVRDSMDDPLFLAADNTPLPGCVCGSWVPNVACGTSSCSGSATKRERVRTCLPIGCEALAGFSTRECYVDDTCCTNPVPRNGGTKVLSCAALVTPPCSDDEYGWQRYCGADDQSIAPPLIAPGSPRYGCTWDPDCAFDCTPTTTPLSTYKYNFCAGSDTGLGRDTPYSYVSPCNGGRCQMQCIAPFVPNGTGTACACPSPFIESGSTCVCPPGSVLTGNTCVFTYVLRFSWCEKSESWKVPLCSSITCDASTVGTDCKIRYGHNSADHFLCIIGSASCTLANRGIAWSVSNCGPDSTAPINCLDPSSYTQIAP